MEKVKRLLELMHNFLPPGENQHHNIIVENGKLMLYIILGERYYSVELEQKDFEMEVHDLALDIYRSVSKVQAEEQGA